MTNNITREGDSLVVEGTVLRRRRKRLPPARYQTRLIAFTDILGFSELVRSTQTQPAQLDQLKQALVLVANAAQEISKSKGWTGWAMAFSDSVVFTEQESLRGFANILIRLAGLSWNILGLGRLVRGAVTSGPLYQAGNIVFGPALIDAYQLERDVAYYPRIIMPDRLIGALDLLPSGWPRAPTSPPDFKQMCRLLIRRDHDGMHFVDFLTAGIHGIRIPVEGLPGFDGFVIGLGGGRGELNDRFSEIRCWLTKELSVTAAGAVTRDPKILVKLAWFRTYFNAVLRENAELRVQTVD